jgi:hypothetical protein
MNLDEILAASAIDPSVAERGGVRAVTGGIVFPYRSPSGRVTEVFRPDAPEPDGPKYRWPKDQPLCLTVHPDMAGLVANPAVPLMIVEGTRQYLAAVTWLNGRFGQCAAIGMNGCWGWSQDHQPSPDLDLIPVAGRDVVLIFDADWRTSAKVGEAAARLTQVLTERGAGAVRRASFGSGKDGLDDVLARSKDPAAELVRIYREANGTHSDLAGLAARYAPVNWEEAFKAQPEDVDWLFEPILECGTVNALFARPGTGKSLYAEEIALGLSRAGRTVVYVDDENRVADLVERLGDMGAGPEDLRNLFLYSFAGLPPLDTPEGGRHLLALATAHDAALVVIDTTSRMVAGRENDSDTFLQLYRCSLVPLKQRGVTVLRLDHPGKDEDRGQRGSSAKDGDVDTIWRMSEVVRDKVFRLDRTKSRSGHGVPALVLERHVNPLYHAVSLDELPPVTSLARQLDDLGIPRNAGRPAARAALKAAGVQVKNAQLEAAIRERKQLPGAVGGSGGSYESSDDAEPLPPDPQSGQGSGQAPARGYEIPGHLTPEQGDLFRELTGERP